MKKAVFAVILILLTGNLYADSLKTCEDRMQSLRIKQMRRLSRMEDDFMKASWSYRKYQEMAYGPLWKAALIKNDRFSEEKQIEGKITFDRYRFLADAEVQKARNAFKNIERRLKLIEQDLVPADPCRNLDTPSATTISDFQNCMNDFQIFAEDHLRDLRKLLSVYYAEQEVFSGRVEATLTDNPSDHETFEDRFHDYLFAHIVKSTSQFLRFTGELEEYWDKKWPAQKCCQICVLDKTMRHDPVLNEVQLDPQGTRGVAGELVNNAGLVEAFDRFEKEENRKPQTKS